MKALVMPLVLGAVAVVAAVSWWMPHGSATADAESSQLVAAEDHLKPIEHSAESDATEASTPPAALPPLDADGGLSSDELFSHLSDPANSDLPLALFTELSELGVAVVRADATGVGRERWPEYWRTSAGRAEPCCSEIVVHAAGAIAHPSGDGTVQVTVVWTVAAAPNGPEAQSVRTSFVRLRRSPTAWEPVR